MTGVSAAWLLDLPLPAGLLLGSIVGSTDAAAVFAILRGKGLRLTPRVAATLEVESGSNDPMAVLLTVGLAEFVQGQAAAGWSVAGSLISQVGIGATCGCAAGWLATRLLDRIHLSAAGLYPAFTTAVALGAYGLPVWLGGSGFLSVYLAGVMIGNADVVFKRGILLAHDGGAWLAQITMFVVLGLLVTPSEIPAVASRGLAVACVLIFVARPVAVAVALLPFGFRASEIGFISWAGLKGAIPVVLAIYPLMLGVPDGALIFNVVFFAVLVSALTQGWSLPTVARVFRVRLPAVPTPPATLEISSLRHVDGDIVEYAVDQGAWVADRMVRELALPDTAVIAMIARGQEIIPPRGTTYLLPGDHVFVVMRPSVRDRVDHLFARRVPTSPPAMVAELPITPAASVGEIEEFYGLHLDSNPARSLAEVLEDRLGVPRVGSAVRAGDVLLTVRRVEDGRIVEVGLEIPAPTDDA